MIFNRNNNKIISNREVVYGTFSVLEKSLEMPLELLNEQARACHVTQKGRKRNVSAEGNKVAMLVNPYYMRHNGIRTINRICHHDKESS